MRTGWEEGPGAGIVDLSLGTDVGPTMQGLGLQQPAVDDTRTRASNVDCLWPLNVQRMYMARRR